MTSECKSKCIITFLLILSVAGMTGCVNTIPPNEHIGKPPPHSYKDSYYYYDGGPYYY